MSKIIVLAFFLNSCASYYVERKGRDYVEPELAGLYAEFMQEVNSKQLLNFNKEVVGVYFDELDSFQAGECFWIKGETTRRYIRIASFIRYEPEMVRWIFYHEAGHCILDKLHVADENDIMYFLITPTWIFDNPAFWKVALVRFWNGQDQEKIDPLHN